MWAEIYFLKGTLHARSVGDALTQNKLKKKYFILVICTKGKISTKKTSHTWASQTRSSPTYPSSNNSFIRTKAGKKRSTFPIMLSNFG